VQLAILNSSLWNKLFKAELFADIYLPECPPRLAEDALLLAIIYPRVSKVAFVPEVLYDLFMHGSSAMACVAYDDFGLTREAFASFFKVCSAESARLCTCIAFIHTAVSFPLLSGVDTRGVIRETYAFLSECFPEWRRALTLRDVFRSKYRGKLVKVYFAFLLYRLRLFGLFVWFWRFLTVRLGVAIKW